MQQGGRRYETLSYFRRNTGNHIVQYDFVSYGVGSGISVWVRLELVSFRFCLPLAAEYLLVLYFVIWILFFNGKKEMAPWADRIWGGSVGITCYPYCYARTEHTFWRADDVGKQYVADGAFRKIYAIFFLRAERASTDIRLVEC